MIADRITKVLIANRGEIAVRILRTCRDVGIATVAVYSEPDRSALHVRLADEAYPIGPAASHASYLSMKNILDAGRRSGADAIHPGYGFLSENAAFAEACAAAGLLFIGPPAGAIRAMGDKTEARAKMQAAGVPVVPGTEGAVDDEREVARFAERVGYPVITKAAAGGGGKGMRVVERPGDIRGALELAQREAQSAFADGRVFVEKYIEQPRHIEFQVLCDAHGGMVHLFERECSIQRRHQKVIEEAPSSVLTPEIRARMGATAVQAARACGYVNAGTVEFLVDAEMNYYFMEMNTRLQVEHPVTEWVTGIDLVAEQLRIAEGAALGYNQEDLTLRGHAIECRVYAEDPASGFLPDPGLLVRHAAPSGPGVRVDAGVEEASRVLLHYDPMISKVSTWGPTRDEALRRMQRALGEYEIAGVKTTIPFCRYVLETDAFRRGNYSTRFVEEHWDPSVLGPLESQVERAAAVAAVLVRMQQPVADGTMHVAGGSPWLRRRE